MAALMDIKKVMALLPHRYPFVLVDRILEFEPGKQVVALKNVTINEPFFQGHFPSNPIMPGVLIIEAMGQTGGVLVYSSLPEPQRKLGLRVVLQQPPCNFFGVGHLAMLFTTYAEAFLERSQLLGDSRVL